MDEGGDRRAETATRFRRALVAAVLPIEDADISDDVLGVVAERAERFSAAMAAGPRVGRLWGYTTGGGNPDVLGSFVLGLAPADVVEANVAIEGAAAHGTVLLGPAFEGPVGAVHGGVVARMLDEIAAIAASVASPGLSVTRQLNVTYHRPTPLERALAIDAVVREVEGRRATVHATIHDGPTLCAEAEVVIVRVG
jgi:acyl-coenzyme A thioesterase PaaI-like protein